MSIRTARVAAGAVTLLVAAGIAPGSARAAVDATRTHTVSFESASATVDVTIAPSDPPQIWPPTSDYEFTGTVTSSGGCYAVWLGYGFVPGGGPREVIGSACADESGDVHALHEDIPFVSGARPVHWLALCRATDPTVCGPYRSLG